MQLPCSEAAARIGQLGVASGLDIQILLSDVAIVPNPPWGLVMTIQFKPTRQRILWGSALGVLFGFMCYGHIMDGRWPRPLGLVATVLVPPLTLFIALTGDFTQTPEQRATARREARNKLILWVVTVIVAYFFFKLNDRYHLFSRPR